MKTSSTDFKMQLTEAFSREKCWLDGHMATLSEGPEYVIVGSSRDISSNEARLLRRLYVWATWLQTARNAKRDMMPDPGDPLNQDDEIKDAFVGAAVSELEYHLVLHLFDHEVLRLFSEKIGMGALSHFALISNREEFSVVRIKEKK